MGEPNHIVGTKRKAEFYETKNFLPPQKYRCTNEQNGSVSSVLFPCIPEVLSAIFVYLEASDFVLASVCKYWAAILCAETFWKNYCLVHWKVVVGEQVKDTRSYIFERFNLENLPLRMKCLIESYAQFPERSFFGRMRSLISLEEYTLEAKEGVLSWIDDMVKTTNLTTSSQLKAEQKKLRLLLDTRLAYEEYDKYTRNDHNDQGAWFGEGWNGSYRIYDFKGSYVTILFECYSHPVHEEQERVQLYWRHNENYIYKIIHTDARDDPRTFIYNSKNVWILREMLDLSPMKGAKGFLNEEHEHVSLVHLFCFLLRAMGADNYQFNSFGTDQFEAFWRQMEEMELTTQSCDEK